MGDCYICTDQTDEQSPCQCKAYVHKECLDTWTEKSGFVRCSICKSRLEGLKIEYLDDDDDEMVRENKNITKGIKILFWFICGFLGKTILALIFEPSILYIAEYWSPFDIVFMVSASVLYLFFEMSFNSCLYLRRVYYNQYENFEDIDSIDGDDSDGDIV